jgi:hypothetical protein
MKKYQVVCFTSRPQGNATALNPEILELPEIYISMEKKPPTVSVPFKLTDIFVKLRNQLQPFCSVNTCTCSVPACGMPVVSSTH